MDTDKCEKEAVIEIDREEIEKDESLNVLEPE